MKRKEHDIYTLKQIIMMIDEEEVRVLENIRRAESYDHEEGMNNFYALRSLDRIRNLFIDDEGQIK